MWWIIKPTQFHRKVVEWIQPLEAYFLSDFWTMEYVTFILQYTLHGYNIYFSVMLLQSINCQTALFQSKLRIVFDLSRNVCCFCYQCNHQFWLDNGYLIFMSLCMSIRNPSYLFASGLQAHWNGWSEEYKLIFYTLPY